MLDLLSDAYAQMRSVQATPHWAVTVVSVILAVAVIVPTPTWRISRNVITIAHEGGHALVARACGRRLNGIRLHSDTSGVTVSSGNPRGIGMIATTFAGYTAPAAIGALLASLLAAGRITATLWATLALLGIMLMLIRNLYGAAILIFSIALAAALLRYGSDQVQTLALSILAWFLLLAAPKPVLELQRKRRQGTAAGSDADQLAALTGIPGAVWVLSFQVTNLAAVAVTVALLAT